MSRGHVKGYVKPHVKSHVKLHGSSPAQNAHMIIISLGCKVEVRRPRYRGLPGGMAKTGPPLRGVIDRSASGVWIFRGQLTFTCVTAR